MATGTDTDNALLGIEDAQAFLGNSTVSTSENDIVRDIINVVSYKFNAETGRKLKARTYTEIYDGNGKDELYLNNWPLASTTITITINADRDFTSTGDQVTSTDIMLSTESGLVRLDGDAFDEGKKNVQIAYTGGYTTSGAFDLIYAAKEYLQTVWDRQTARESISARTEAFEGVSRSFDPDYPWSVKKVLDLYREGRAY